MPIKALLAVVTCMVFSLAVLPASAAAEAVWTSEYPAGTTRSAPGVVAVDVFGASLLPNASATMTIDGTAYRGRVTSGLASGHWTSDETLGADGAYHIHWSWAADTGGSTKSSIFCYPPTLSDGPHSVSVAVADAGVVSPRLTHGWSFDVAAPPVFGAPAPRPGSTVPTSTPAIVIPLADNGAVATAAATVDAVPATVVLGSGTATVSGFGVLPDGLATVSVTATDAGGNAAARSWSFTVLAAAPAACPACHGGQGFESDQAMGPDCTSCHSGAAAPAHGLTGTHPSQPGDAACAGCHGSGLTVVHGRLGCVCHTQPTADVSAVVARGGAACTDCHAAASTGGHVAVHDTDVGPVVLDGGGGATCGDCHDTNLMTEHARPTASSAASGCAACHPSPRSTITTLDPATCVQGGCHTSASSAPMHAGIASAHTVAGPPDCFGSGCHAGPSSDLTTIHSSASTVTAGVTRSGCGVCHSTTTVPASGACASCHDLADPHGAIDGVHTSSRTSADLVFITGHNGGTQVVDTDCTMCHARDLITLHGSDCSRCHQSTDPTVRGAIAAGVTDCLVCHATYHANMVSGHRSAVQACTFNCHLWVAGGDAPVSSDPAWCGGCHALYPDVTPPVTTVSVATSTVGDAAVRISSKKGLPGVMKQFYRLDGGATQTIVIMQTSATTVSTVTVPAPASGSQTHTLQAWAVDWSGNAEVAAAPVSFTLTRDSTPPTTTSDTKPSYAGDATIHLTATDDSALGVLATYYSVDGAASAVGTTVVVPQPATGTAGHTLQFWSVDFAGNVETSHSVAFSVARDSTPPATTIAWNDSYYLLSASLTATDPGGSGVAATYCSADGAAWQRATAASMPARDGWHTVQFYSVDKMGNVEATETSQYLRDKTAPVTTSDAQPSYAGTATVHLIPVDPYSGVKSTSYRIDAGTYVSGTTVTIAPPVSGSQSHTIQFYSIDNKNNVEVVRSATFTVFKTDVTPPVTSSDATSSYIGPATITLSATDVGGTGVRATAYRLDGGAVTTASVVTVPAPLSGSAAHVLDYWSLDWAGNREATHTVSFSVGKEIIPPVTTSDAVGSYAYAATIHLSASDAGGSGLADTFYRLDGGTVATGTTIAVAGPKTGMAMHTLQFWSDDHAGNVEATNTAVFWITADELPPVTTSDVRASYVLTAPITLSLVNDPGGSGLASFGYSLDGAPSVLVPGGYGWAEVDVPAPASGDVTHTLSWWGVDVAGNVETAHAATFTVSADHFPPVTTCPQDGRYVGAQQLSAFELCPTDDTGVAVTYYSMDGDPWQLATPDTNGLPVTRGYRLAEGAHQLHFYSIDTLGNREATESATIDVDATPPHTTSDIASSYAGVAVLTFTSEDDASGVQLLDVYVDGVSCYPLNWQSGTVIPSKWVQSWEISAPSTGTVTHRVDFFAYDNVNNRETTNTVYFTQSAPSDKTPPSGTMTIDGGAQYSTSATLWADSSVVDTGTGLWEMRWDRGMGSFGDPWMPYASHYEFPVSAGEGLKTIRAQYRDYAGNTLTLSGAITVDLNGPSGTMTLAGGAPVTYDASVTVASVMSDWVSGVPVMRIDPGSGTYGAWVPYAATQSVQLAGGDGTKTVNVQYRDGAGNVSTRTGTIVLQTAGP